MASQYATFTLPVNHEPQNEEEFNRFLRSHRIIQVVHRFVEQENTVYWTFLVEYIQGTNTEKNVAGAMAVDYKDILSESDFSIFRTLRDVRKIIAENAGIPPYSVFTNKQLADISQKRPKTTSELKSIDGIGEGKVERYGKEILKAIQNLTQCVESEPFSP